MMDWDQVVKESMELVRDRVIRKDSDGNLCRVTFDPGSEEKIVGFMEDHAPKAMSGRGLCAMLAEQIEVYGRPACEGEPRTS